MSNKLFKCRYSDKEDGRVLNEVASMPFPDYAKIARGKNGAQAHTEFELARTEYFNHLASLQSLLCPSMKKEMDGEVLREDEIEMEYQVVHYHPTTRWKTCDEHDYDLTKPEYRRIIATIKEQEKRIGTDNICPITKVQCNDEWEARKDFHNL